ncbi:glycosyltransferase [Hoylesella nanceiensis]|jgi:glycosyltransferase|uniref:glycosyltransferase n=1 Tax=Hoylesella nanceiensis TaxID=425941 RepID=UPI00241C06C4|nr:glycosyltransferase [Hoylesella nanceiensis]
MSSYDFSVIMSVYKNDNPEQLDVALDSIINQTLPPNEIIVVVDGPVPDESVRVLENKKQVYPELKVFYQKENQGLGAVLRIAVANAQYDYLARMDSDDIALPNRFELQMNEFKKDNNLSLVGGMITEFADTPENIISKRILPCSDADIKQFMKSRCGLNHMTVIMKKKDLLKAGNYQPDFRQEDYYLWARMILTGCTFKNIPEVVVNVRSGYDQFARRGGLKYYKDVLKFNRWMYEKKLISLPRMIYNDCVRGLVQFLLPNSIRTFIYKKALRN